MSRKRVIIGVLGGMVVLAVIGAVLCARPPKAASDYRHEFADQSRRTAGALVAPTPDGENDTTTLADAWGPLAPQHVFQSWFLRQGYRETLSFEQARALARAACRALETGTPGSTLAEIMAGSAPPDDVLVIMTDIVEMGVKGHCPEQAQQLGYLG